MTSEHQGRHTALAALLGLVLTAILVLVAAAPAGAQSFPAGCDEYDDPTCIGPVDAADGSNDDDGGNVGPGGDGDGDGKLPFTGYPLTGLILLFLALLAIGLAIRGYVAARDRLVRSPNAP